MEKTCTWEGCKDAATHPQVDDRGKEWAALCAEHHAELNRSIALREPAGLIKSWVKAKGGAKPAAKSMTEG